MYSYRSLHLSGEDLETDFSWSWSRLGLEVLWYRSCIFLIGLETGQLLIR